MLKLGAFPITNGYRFFVWAPNAEAVFLIGTFNNWEKDSLPLIREKNGTWKIDVPDVIPGDEYKYRIISEGRELMRIDPYARRVTHSAGNAIILDPDNSSKDTNFSIPSWNESIIYRYLREKREKCGSQ